ncbi:transmembrane protein 209-like isoform X2 [Amphiura filiformis]
MENVQQQHIGSASTPLVEKTLRRQAGNSASKSALSWAACNCMLAIICYLELAFHTVGEFFEVHHPSIWYVACALAVLFTINTVVDLGKFLVPTIRRVQDPIHLSPMEKSLLGVKDKDVGFKTRTRRIASAPSNLNSYTGSPTIQPPSTYLYPSASVSTPHSSFHGTPPSSRMKSHHNSPVFSTSFASQGSPYVTPQQSFTSMTPATSPRQSPASPMYRDNSSSNSLLRSRHHQSSPVQRSPSTVTSDAIITDKNALNSYLKSYEEKERRHQLGSSESSPSGSPSFWSINRSAADFTPLLRKFQYQLASRSPQSPARNDDDPDYPATYGAEEVWGKCGIVRDELEGWIANLRMYISQTILRSLVRAIDEVNSALKREGRAELQIGEVSISSLRHVILTRSKSVQTLKMVLPYLDIHSNQEYVVQRIRDLSKGGCMSDFRWNQGSEFKGRKWDQDLPTDSAIVMHMLCSYLDSRLPAHPKYPDGKTFASQYFMKTPDKPDLKKKDNLLLFQTKINPPHYKVIITDDTWDLPKGRSNMFQAILLFLHHVKTKEHGMVG